MCVCACHRNDILICSNSWVNSALHPSGVTKSSTSFGWGKGGNVTSAGWQVTLCDPIWPVSSRSGDGRLACKLLYLSLLIFCIVLLLNVLSSWQIRAQRKFASNGASLSCSTPEVKCRSSSYTPKCLFPERKVATEDFLTFLCLRGTRNVSRLTFAHSYFIFNVDHGFNCLHLYVLHYVKFQPTV